MKKIISVLLAVLMLLSAIPFAVFAAEDTGNQVRYIVDSLGLWGIDFSEVIQDMNSVNKGLIELRRNDDNTVWDYILFDENGTALICCQTEDGGFTGDYIIMDRVNVEMTLCPKRGYLFDNVETYTFSIRDVYDSMGEGTTFCIDSPEIEVSEIDGNLVRQLTLDFNDPYFPYKGSLLRHDGITDPYYKKESFLPVNVDMDTKIKLTVSIMELGKAEYDLVPIAYDGNGKLTVSVRNHDGSEGVALYNARIGTDKMYKDVNKLSLFIPEGLFCIKDSSVMSREENTRDPYHSFKNLPVKYLVRINTGNLLLRIGSAIYNRISSDSIKKMFVMLFAPLLIPFPITQVMGAILNLSAAYGIPSRGNGERVRWMNEMFAETVRWLLEK